MLRPARASHTLTLPRPSTPEETGRANSPPRVPYGRSGQPGRLVLRGVRARRNGYPATPLAAGTTQQMVGSGQPAVFSLSEPPARPQPRLIELRACDPSTEEAIWWYGCDDPVRIHTQDMCFCGHFHPLGQP